MAIFHVPYEHREVVLRVLDHVGPGRVAGAEVGPSRPAQACEHRLRHALDADAPVAVVLHEILRLLDLRSHGQHRTQHLVRPVGGEALEAGFPGVQVEVLEFLVGVVLGHVDGLGDAGVHVGRHRRHHLLVRARGNLQRGDEPGRQLGHVAARRLVAAPGVVLDREFLERAVGHALLARVDPGEGRLDAVGGVVGEGEADGASRRDRQQVRIAEAVLLDERLYLFRQAGRKAGARKEQVGVEKRKSAALLRQIDRGLVRLVAHRRRDFLGHGARLGRVVAQAQHRERIAQPRKAQADAPLCHRFLALLLERPGRHLEHVVEHSYRDMDCF